MGDLIDSNPGCQTWLSDWSLGLGTQLKAGALTQLDEICQDGKCLRDPVAGYS